MISSALSRELGAEARVNVDFVDRTQRTSGATVRRIVAPASGCRPARATRP